METRDSIRAPSKIKDHSGKGLAAEMRQKETAKGNTNNLTAPLNSAREEKLQGRGHNQHNAGRATSLESRENNQEKNGARSIVNLERIAAHG